MQRQENNPPPAESRDVLQDEWAIKGNKVIRQIRDPRQFTFRRLIHYPLTKTLFTG